MKYCLYICFSQTELMKYPGLDVTDLVLIQWAKEFFSRGSADKKIIDGETYCWMSYELMERDLPFLKISQETIRKRMKKLIDLGMLTHKCITTEFTKRSYFGIGPNLESIEYSPGKTPKNPTGGDKPFIPGGGWNNNSTHREENTDGCYGNDTHRENSTVPSGKILPMTKETNRLVSDKEDTSFGSKEEVKTSSAQPRKRKSLAERKQEFHDEVFSHTEYPKEMLQAFYNHFSEADRAKNPKMLCEKEKTWETDLRLANWHARDRAKYGQAAQKRDPRKVYEDDNIIYTDKI